MREKHQQDHREMMAAGQPSPPSGRKGHRSSLQHRHRRRRRPDPPPPPQTRPRRSPTPTPPPPETTRRSLRPRRSRLFIADDSDSPSSGEEKGQLVLKLPDSPASPAAIHRIRRPAAAPIPSSSSSSSSDSASFDDDDGEDAVKPLKKRRIGGRDDDGGGGGSDGSGHREEWNGVLRRSKSAVSGMLSVDSPKRTMLPDRRTLEGVLDKLQKKDTYRVYAQPVDLEELPDYQEVIEHPMDFGTIRKKLKRSAYRTFEQFEDDVFLICSNAMQYNAPHTIYFRQARAIEEMARKEFQILRADAKVIGTERKSEDKIKFGSTEKKPLKKPLHKAEKEPIGSDISSSATHAFAGSTCTGQKMEHADGLKLRRASACEKPAISNGSTTTRVNAVDKAATSSGLCMVPASAVEKPVPVNGAGKGHGNNVQRPAISKGLSGDLVNNVPSSTNVLITEQANAVKKHPPANKSTTARASAAEKPSTTEGLITTQADASEEAGNTHGLSAPGANAIEKPTTSAVSSMIVVNAIEKPTTSAVSSMIVVNAIEKPTTSNGLGTSQANAFEQPTTANGFADCNSSLDESKSEKTDECLVKCSPSKLGRKPLLVDENRRATYSHYEQQPVVESDSVFHVFYSETKQLVDVGSHSEHSYARSLARFAAFLGPIGWEIASKKIEKVLPSGIKFGPGWVGEYEPLPTPVLSLENHTQQQLRYGPDLRRRGSKTDREAEVRSNATRIGVTEDVKLGLKGQVNTGMPQRVSHPKVTIFCEQKQDLLGSSSKRQPRVINAMLQQRNHVAVDSARDFNDVSQEIILQSSSSVSSVPVEKAPRRPKLYPEAHKQMLFGVSADIQPRLTNAISQQQKKDQEVIDFTKACNNASEQIGGSKPSSFSSIPVETDFRRPEYHSEAQRQGMFDVSSVSQQRITNTMLHQQTDQGAIGTNKAFNSASEQVRVCYPSSASNTPIEIALQRDVNHSQSQKQIPFGVSAEIQSRITDIPFQDQKNHVAINFVNAYNNGPEHIRAQNSFPMSNIPAETDLQKTVGHSEAVNYWTPGLIARNKNQLPLEPKKSAETVNAQDGKDSLGLTVGAFSHKATGSAYDNRAITSLQFNSNKQSGGAGYSVGGGSRGQAIDFRLIDLSGNMSNQPNYLNTNIYSAKQTSSSAPPPTRDDSSSAAAARTWMSFGASAECQSVCGTGTVHTQIESASSHGSAWKTPTSSPRIHGGTMSRPQVFPQPIPVGNEESQVQNRGLPFFPQLVATDLSRFHGRSPWQGMSPHTQPRQKDMRPPDLNIGFQPPGSPVRPSPGILVDPQQPDLALQL